MNRQADKKRRERPGNGHLSGKTENKSPKYHALSRTRSGAVIKTLKRELHTGAPRQTTSRQGKSIGTLSAAQEIGA